MTLPRSKSGLKRSGPIARNRKRQKRLFVENFGGAGYLAAIRAMPCAICGVEGYSQAAHVVSRGAGGKASDLVPLCCDRPTRSPGGCHTRFDRYRWTLPEGTEERLKTLAAELYAAHTQALTGEKK